MPFSEKALKELEERLGNEAPKTERETSEEDLDGIASLLTNVIAASLKMRQRFHRVGRPLPSGKKIEEAPTQGLLPGFGIDERKRDGTQMGC